MVFDFTVELRSRCLESFDSAWSPIPFFRAMVVVSARTTRESVGRMQSWKSGKSTQRRKKQIAKASVEQPEKYIVWDFRIHTAHT